MRYNDLDKGTLREGGTLRKVGHRREDGHGKEPGKVSFAFEKRSMNHWLICNTSRTARPWLDHDRECLEIWKNMILIHSRNKSESVTMLALSCRSPIFSEQGDTVALVSTKIKIHCFPILQTLSVMVQQRAGILAIHYENVFKD